MGDLKALNGTEEDHEKNEVLHWLSIFKIVSVSQEREM